MHRAGRASLACGQQLQRASKHLRAIGADAGKALVWRLKLFGQPFPALGHGGPGAGAVDLRAIPAFNRP